MHQTALVDSSEQSLLARARAGDSEAFASLVAPYRRGIHVHCYRMLGSLHDAEDLLQEVLLSAWRRLDQFEGRSSLRAWLYRIASNACLDALKHRRRRLLPDSYQAADDPLATPAQALLDAPWIEPYPDGLLDGADDPAHRYEAREALALAFIATIQRLSPRQRAVLILRDALGFSASETAAMLETTIDSVNGSLKRARLALEGRYPRRLVSAGDAPLSGDEEALVARYVDAWEAADVDGLVALLREDARMTMPPTPSWYDGREAVGAFLSRFFAGLGRGSRLLITRANGQPAVAVYTRQGERYGLLALQVLTITGAQIEAITGFTDPTLFPFFALAERHDFAPASQASVAGSAT
jgi:RNA polymerase sigma-70 factor (TIGR02960 family)